MASLFDAYKRHFPNLDQSKFVVTSPATPRYNCIAFAAGVDDAWWWPDPFNYYYWPPTVFRLENLQTFQAAFATIGYSLCADGSLEFGFEKVAIYHKDNVPTHGARQLSDGTWVSKLGESHDVEHSEACLDGSSYGSIAFFMRRPMVNLPSS